MTATQTVMIHVAKTSLVREETVFQTNRRQMVELTVISNPHPDSYCSTETPRK